MLISLASTAISAIRKAKTDAKRSIRAQVETVRVHGPADQLSAIEAIKADLQAVGNVQTFELQPTGDHDLHIEVSLSAE